MPIYAYKCETCGHAKDVLQKMSDPLLTVCPACGNATFKKQLTAAGFQLKGTGWYVTDFREGSGKNSELPTEPKTGSTESAGASAPASSDGKSAESTPAASSAATKSETAAKPAVSSPAPTAPAAAKATPSSNA